MNKYFKFLMEAIMDVKTNITALNDRVVVLQTQFTALGHELNDMKKETIRNMKVCFHLLDYQFEITARSNISHRYGLYFSNLYSSNYF